MSNVVPQARNRKHRALQADGQLTEEELCFTAVLPTVD